MAFRLSTTCRNGGCDGIVDACEGGTPPAVLKVYDGAQPATVAGNPSGTLLGTLTFTNPAFGAASVGVATASAITSDTSADASGTAGHFAIYTGTALTPLADGTCGQGTGDLSFDNSVIVAGGTIAVSSFVVTLPIS